MTLLLSLASIVFVGTVGGFVAMWSAHRIERKRQAFQLEQDARGDRAQAMRSARILDTVLMEAEALLAMSVMKHNRLWVEILAVPDSTVWL